MILAEKINMFRKKAGWAQEELAEQLNVTRQSRISEGLKSTVRRRRLHTQKQRTEEREGSSHGDCQFGTESQKREIIVSFS